MHIFFGITHNNRLYVYCALYYLQNIQCMFYDHMWVLHSPCHQVLHNIPDILLLQSPFVALFLVLCIL